jgi:hypothetical protein
VFHEFEIEAEFELADGVGLLGVAAAEAARVKGAARLAAGVLVDCAQRVSILCLDISSYRSAVDDLIQHCSSFPNYESLSLNIRF